MGQPSRTDLTEVNLLDLVPQRTAEWRDDDGTIVVERNAPPRPWRSPIEWLGYKMSVKRLRLDEVGSFAWKLLDGRSTVAQIAARLRSEFGDRVEPAEERFGELLRMMHRGGLIDYAGGGLLDSGPDRQHPVGR